jgi:hypothetical protein
MAEQTSSDTRTQFWKEQIEAWQASGRSQHAFCKTHDLSYPRFGYWLRKFRARGEGAAAPCRSSGFVSAIASSGGDGLVVHLPNGIELRGITEQNVSLAEQLLARL